MRIAVIRNTDARIGGGRTFEDLLCQTLLTDLSDQFEFSTYLPKGDSSYGNRDNKSLSQTVYNYSLSATSTFLQTVRNNPFGFRALEPFGFALSGLERHIQKSNADVAFFISPNPLASGISTVPVISTIWDLAHTLEPEFPEVVSRRRHEYRDYHFRRAARRSAAVVVDSPEGAEQVVISYGIPTRRTVVLPFWGLVDSWGSPSVTPADYVVYPAQFWPHKNHRILIEALTVLRAANRPSPRLLLVGGDQGNMGFIRDLIQNRNLESKIELTGFLPDEVLRDVVLASKGLAMPTYFGPTNLPPVEALKSGIPVAVSTVDQLSRHSDGKSIQAIAPDDAAGWADALERFELGKVPRPAKAPSSVANLPKASAVLEQTFHQIQVKLRTWKTFE